MALARRTFTANGSFTAPAAVNSVKIIGTAFQTPMNFGGSANAFTGNDGVTYSFGANLQASLGDGQTAAAQSGVSSPVVVLGSGALNFAQIFVGPSGGGDSFFGVTASGDAYAWGYNVNGQLGIGNVTAQSSPVIVLGGLKFSSIQSYQSGPGSKTIGLTPTGAAYAWGINPDGELGIGNVTTVSSPTLVLGGLSFKQVLMTSYMTYGLTTAGAAYGWGRNDSGAAGNGNVNPQSSPVAVLGGLTFASLTTDLGGSFTATSTFGITAAGVAYAWGNNQNGQLGIGNVTMQSSPIAVLGGLSFKQIIVNNYSVIGLTTAGAAYGWGANANGQLGIGNVTPQSSPVAVLGGLTFTNIFVINGNGQSFFGLTAAGLLYGWGINAQGQLGVGDVIPRSSPVAVLGGLSFAQMFSNYGGYQSAMAVATTGQLYGWGGNFAGQLGLGTNLNAQSSPIAVIGGKFPNFAPLQYIKSLPVTPGTAYAINLANPVGMFGTTQIGPMLTQLVVEYEQ